MATAAACSKVRFAGLGASLSSGARAYSAYHLIAGLESGHGLADGLDDAGHVRAWNGVLGRPETVAREAYRVRQARHDVPGAAVHAGRMHADQHLVLCDFGLVYVPELEDVGWAVVVLDNRLHGGSSLHAVDVSGAIGGANTSPSDTSATSAVTPVRRPEVSVGNLSVLGEAVTRSPGPASAPRCRERCRSEVRCRPCRAGMAGSYRSSASRRRRRGRPSGSCRARSHRGTSGSGR
jgi:hypothetical protein